MYLSESLQSKWEGVLEHPDLPSIKDPYRKAVTAVILENQAVEMQKASGMLTEAGPTNSMGSTGFSGGNAAGGPVAGFDPILISLVRRSLPNLIAYDICGVQPMTGPTGLIFAMRTRFANQGGTEHSTTKQTLHTLVLRVSSLMVQWLFLVTPPTICLQVTLLLLSQ